MQQAMLLKANSGMSSAVISRMVDDDPYKAKSYFQTAQEGMTAEDQVQISRLIDREIKSREIEARQDRKSVVAGKSGSGRGELGGRRTITKKKRKTQIREQR